MPWGVHYSLNASGLDANKISDPANIKNFIETLVEAISMIAHGDPRIEYFAEAPSPDAGGYTLEQTIKTSNIACHFVDNPREAYLDVFSCKTFDPADALRVFKEFFAADDFNYEDELKERQAPPPKPK